MTEIKFARDYGYPPATPFWLIWNEGGNYPRYKHPTREAAETEAARLASIAPGEDFHILAVMATVSTSADIVGTRFDPTRSPPVAEEAAPEPIEELLAPKFIATPSGIAFDGKPF